MADSKKKDDCLITTFRLDVEVKRRLVEVVEQEERSLSWLINKACEEFVARLDEKPKIMPKN